MKEIERRVGTNLSDSSWKMGCKTKQQYHGSAERFSRQVTNPNAFTTATDRGSV